MLFGDFRSEEVGGDSCERGEDRGQEDTNVTNVNRDSQLVKNDVKEAAG